MNLRIKILKPEAKHKLDELVKLGLIQIEETEENDFFSLLARLRKNQPSPSELDVLTEEVNLVREKRHKYTSDKRES